MSFGTVQIIAHNSFFSSDLRPQMSDCGALDIFSKQFKMIMNFRLLKISVETYAVGISQLLFSRIFQLFKEIFYMETILSHLH